ncbi:uncharacterized protein LOC123296138 [Chrysoperla carnea]|uniref:uncharacterized protein LOC123296138 n=1 Tax=Chrysoperla carnea TaxID=189513 RepID=UPI001D082E92|nr:uncharacterized protein LOC123296138 [Chrysoperla carnea]
MYHDVLPKHHIILPCSKPKENTVSGASSKASFNGPYGGMTTKTNPGYLRELISLTLNDDLDEFGKVLWSNIEALFALFSQCYALDETFRTEIEKIFDGTEVYELMDMILIMPEFEEFMKFLQDNGLKDMDDFDMNTIQDVINTIIPPNVKENLIDCSHKKNCLPSCETPGLKGFIETAKNLIDMNAFQNLYDEKLQTSEPFQKLVEYLQSEKFLIIVRAVRCNANFKKIVNDAVESGIDVQYIREVLNKHLGW